MVTEAANGRTRAVVLSLAFVAGFADTATFVGAGGIFCAHVTGNFVVLAADLARGAGRDEWLKLATFPIFVFAVLTSTWLYRRLGATPSDRTVRLLLATKGVLFGIAAAIGWMAPPGAPGISRILIVTLLVTALAVQNAIHRFNPGLGPMTTVMTGNVTAWLVEAFGPPAPDGGVRHRTLAAILISFTIGCALGGLGVAHFGFVILVIPMLVTLSARSRLA